MQSEKLQKELLKKQKKLEKKQQRKEKAQEKVDKILDKKDESQNQDQDISQKQVNLINDENYTFLEVAGKLKVGQFIMLKDNQKPCKIVEMSFSKAGKHGSAKISFTGIDIISNKKYYDFFPSQSHVQCPFVEKIEALLADYQFREKFNYLENQSKKQVESKENDEEKNLEKIEKNDESTENSDNDSEFQIDLNDLQQVQSKYLFIKVQGEKKYQREFYVKGENESPFILCSKQFVQNTVQFVQNQTQHSNCQFRIIPVLHFSKQLDIQAKLEKRKKFYNALEQYEKNDYLELVEKEQKENAKLIEEMDGKTLNLGVQFYLEHCKSKQVLGIICQNSSQIKDEDEFVLKHEETPQNEALFQFLPYFKDLGEGKVEEAKYGQKYKLCINLQSYSQGKLYLGLKQNQQVPLFLPSINSALPVVVNMKINNKKKLEKIIQSGDYLTLNFKNKQFMCIGQEGELLQDNSYLNRDIVWKIEKIDSNNNICQGEICFTDNVRFKHQRTLSYLAVNYNDKDQNQNNFCDMEQNLYDGDHIINDKNENSFVSDNEINQIEINLQNARDNLDHLLNYLYTNNTSQMAIYQEIQANKQKIKSLVKDEVIDAIFELIVVTCENKVQLYQEVDFLKRHQ
ncbi:Translation protein SH3-like domain [Pseudocohnilembus persalinus]|uniref:Translation protein SH3-like domain n=1 Tax=Pseudocohnilembus persalinus TaxID=266149 RepID=A0A0V0QLD3_PSEPJ|nr:Translation protein SH3-like domain [Pseudocohnilembus persalinus]|eukprot:KRX03067.1 Translation protein SH3-like domain [Pseudocohnilembus persalinus]